MILVEAHKGAARGSLCREGKCIKNIARMLMVAYVA